MGTASNAWEPAKRQDLDTSFNQRATIYLKLKPGANAGALEQLLQHSVDQSPYHQKLLNSNLGRSLHGRKVTDIALIPLRSAYFDEGLAHGAWPLAGAVALALALAVLVALAATARHTVAALRLSPAAALLG